MGSKRPSCGKFEAKAVGSQEQIQVLLLASCGSLHERAGQPDFQRNAMFEGMLNQLLSMRCSIMSKRAGTALPHISWSMAMTFAPCRNSWVTRMSKRPCFTHMCYSVGGKGCAVRSIHGEGTAKHSSHAW
jgi:hypothetical protein